MAGSIVTGVLVAAVPILLGLIVYQWQQRVNRREEGRRARRLQITEYLTEAYRSIYAIGPAGGIGGLTTDEKKGVERAFRDAYLFGNRRVAAAIGEFMDWAHDETRLEGMSTTGIIDALVGQLRELYQLDNVKERDGGYPWIQTEWRHEVEARRILDSAKDLDIFDRLVSIGHAASFLTIPPDGLLSCVRNGRLPAPIGLKGTLFWPAETIFKAAHDLQDLKYSDEEWEKAIQESTISEEPSNET